jgi:hypothetical protein
MKIQKNHCENQFKRKDSLWSERKEGIKKNFIVQIMVYYKEEVMDS